jgi:hypothetical protein
VATLAGQLEAPETSEKITKRLNISPRLNPSVKVKGILYFTCFNQLTVCIVAETEMKNVAGTDLVEL